MELEITTKMSILVGLAGFLAEIIFRETLTSSVAGVILSVILAAIILCCTYFAMDGLQRGFLAIHKREENRRREYDEKLFRLLNKKLSDGVKLEKGIYSILARGAKGDLSMADTGAAQDYWRELAESIDSSSIKAAKLVVKYNQKSQEESGRIMGQSSEEMLQELRSMSNQLQMLNGEIQELALRATAMAEENAAPDGGALTEDAGEEFPSGDTEDIFGEQEQIGTDAAQSKSIEELLQAAGEEFFQPQEEDGESLPEIEEALAPEGAETDSIVPQETQEAVEFQPQEEAKTDPLVTQEPEEDLAPEEAETNPIVTQELEEDLAPEEAETDPIATQELEEALPTEETEKDSDLSQEVVEALLQEEAGTDFPLPQEDEVNPPSQEEAGEDSAAPQLLAETLPQDETEEGADSLLQPEEAGDIEIQKEADLADLLPQEEAETDVQMAEEELSPARSAVQQGIEEVDVNRMMEELFNESLGEEADETPEEQMPSEHEISHQAGESAPAIETASNDSDGEDLSEEDLDSLLSGLLPEPEPLMEEPLEEAVGQTLKEAAEKPAEQTIKEAAEEPGESVKGLTALDMLLNHQKASKKTEKASSEQTVSEKALTGTEDIDPLSKPIEPEIPTAEPEPLAGEASPQGQVPEPETADPDEEAALGSETASQTEEAETPEPDKEQDTGKMSPDDIAALLASLDS